MNQTMKVLFIDCFQANFVSQVPLFSHSYRIFFVGNYINAHLFPKNLETFYDAWSASDLKSNYISFVALRK